ncbi:hypothetical protein IWX90DRAFT_16571 [Phyllosticta citrichinensis]|uniref:Uncharacterized protein n=1 Tax=Phyllosticta citrichinensis TaxID=1130410 RepID=A0ABR1Y7E9_9PEZI
MTQQRRIWVVPQAPQPNQRRQKLPLASQRDRPVLFPLLWLSLVLSPGWRSRHRGFCLLFAVPHAPFTFNAEASLCTTVGAGLLGRTCSQVHKIGGRQCSRCCPGLAGVILNAVAGSSRLNGWRRGTARDSVISINRSLRICCSLWLRIWAFAAS